jgi:predicted MFS family arabinose efflux permease
MKWVLLIAGLLLALGVVFGGARLKRAFQIGAVLYAVVLVVRLLVFGFGDRDNLTDILTLVSIFFLIWLLAWGGTQVALRYRSRSDRSKPGPAPDKRRRRWR